MVGSQPLIRRLDLVADNSQPLHVRAIAAWYSSGVEWDDERRVGKGDLPGLTALFRSLGVPKALALATQHAACRTREPITIMVPVIWLEAAKQENAPVLDCALPPARVIKVCRSMPWTCTPPSAKRPFTGLLARTRTSARR